MIKEMAHLKDGYLFLSFYVLSELKIRPIWNYFQKQLFYKILLKLKSILLQSIESALKIIYNELIRTKKRRKEDATDY